MTAPIRKMLRQYRALGEIDQKDLAVQIGVSPSSLCRFEQGKSMDEASTIKLIAWLFGHAYHTPPTEELQNARHARSGIPYCDGGVH